MTREQLIPIIEFCTCHEIEFSFINSLQEFGLVEIIRIQQIAYIHSQELPKLEQILLFNKELEINLEGIEVIMRLLERVNQIEEDVNILRNRLRIYENL